MDNLQLLKQLPCDQGVDQYIYSTCLQQGGGKVFSSGNGMKICIWSTMWEFEGVISEEGKVTHISCFGECLAVAVADGSIHVWNWKEKTMIFGIKPHFNSMVDGVLSVPGGLLMTASRHENVKLITMDDMSQNQDKILKQYKTGDYIIQIIQIYCI